MRYIDEVSDALYDAITGGEYDIDFSQFDDKDDCVQYLYDYFVDEDAITGGGSGSYTMDREEAKESIMEDPYVVADVIRDNDLDSDFLADVFDGDWEKLDVICRQSILWDAIDLTMDNLVSNDDDSVKSLRFDW